MNGSDEAGRSARTPLLPDTWRRPVLGVLGGMGPAATVTFLDTLIRRSGAVVDQEHIDTVVLNHVSIPDRTARLLDERAEDPTPYLMNDLGLLARLGVDAAVILCNTSHAFLPEDLPVPLISLVQTGAQAVVERAGGAGSTVTLLATSGTLASGVYQRSLEAQGARVRVPQGRDQERVMAIIYDGVKAGLPVPTRDLLAVADDLGAGTDAVLLGCTELSVLYEQGGHDMPGHIVDAQAALVARVLAQFSPGPLD